MGLSIIAKPTSARMPASRRPASRRRCALAVAERHVVDDGRAAGAQALDRADQRAQVDLARRQRHRHPGAHQVLPQLERQVLGATALEVLVRVLVAVDQPRHQHPAGEVDHRVGPLDRAGRLDRRDPVAVDQHVERPRRPGLRVPQQRGRPAQHRPTGLHRRSPPHCPDTTPRATP
jgi:hypothetical protein